MYIRTATLAFILFASTGCASLERHTFSDEEGAIRGYDPVAYFTDGQPVKGRGDITLEHAGGIYHFANEKSRALFEADPARYAPQYGGYCAYAMARGFVVSTDPNAWHIHNDKLYLNYSLGVRDRWLPKKEEFIIKADDRWTEKLAKGIDG